MLGRAAYHNTSVLADVDRLFYGDCSRPVNWAQVRDAMMDHAQRHIDGGGRLVHVTRHMVGLFHGLPGARRYRQILSNGATRGDASPALIAEAFGAVRIDEPLVA